MNYSKENLEKNQVKFAVETSKEEWTNAIEEAYHKTKGKYNIEGFRKGKAPRRVIESYYGVGVFFESALDIIIPKLYDEIMEKEQDIRPVAQPDVDIVAISDVEVKLNFTVAVYPEVTLGKYTGLTIENPVVKISDDAVQAEIKKAQERVAAWEDITDRAAAKGDTVVIDYSGSIDGVKFDGGTAEKQNLELGSGMFIPGFEEQVEGMKIGEDRDITVKFPEDYGAEGLSGKDAVFAVKLHEIKAKVLPEINDDFAKDVSEYDTLKEYEDSIRKTLTEQEEARAERELEDNIINEIIKDTKVDIPEQMIESQISEMIREFEYRLQYQGMNINDYYKYTNTTPDMLASQYRERAEKNVLIRLTMSEIIKAEKINASDDELDSKIADFAKGANKSLEEYKSSMQPMQMDYIANEVIMDKLFLFLKENNKIGVKKATKSTKTVKETKAE